MLVTSRDSESCRRACGDNFKLGVVLYDSGKPVPFGERLVAAPISRLWGCLDFRDLRAQDEGAIRSENAIDPLWAAATLVVDVFGRAGRIVAGVDREHEFGPFAESIVRLLYDFSYRFITTLLSIVYSGGGGGSRTIQRVANT